MERRYYGITLTGLRRTGPHTLERHIEKLRALIQDHRLAQKLPAIKYGLFEKTTAFVFLGHEEDPDELPRELPDAVRCVFNKFGHLGQIICPQGRYGGHTLDEISKLTRGNLSTETVGSLSDLFRHPALIEAAPVALDLSAMEAEEGDASSDPDLAARHLHLLDWLSARGSGTWELFVRACVSLGLARADQPNRLRSLVRHLMLLGHVQVSPDQGHWCACPLALVASTVEQDTVFLCGQQTEAVRRALEERLGPQDRQSQPDDAGPPTIAFRAAAEVAGAITEAAGVPVRFVGLAARSLCDGLPGYQGWLASLKRDGELRTAAFPSCSRFDGVGFTERAHPYEDGGRAVGQEGLYEFTTGEGEKTYRYLDAAQGVWRTGDFHSLRFAGWVAARGPGSVILLPDGTRTVIPCALRWPLLHERCLVLASGRLPRRSAQGPSLTYQGVGRELLARLADKLPFQFEESIDA